jgi:hypothetical protein
VIESDGEGGAAPQALEAQESSLDESTLVNKLDLAERFPPKDRRDFLTTKLQVGFTNHHNMHRGGRTAHAQMAAGGRNRMNRARGS